MAFSTIDKGSLYQNTVLYSGNGTTNAITGVNFAPDFCWLKCITTGYHNRLYNKVRGVNNNLRSDGTWAEQSPSPAEGLSVFGSDGFTIVEGSSLSYNTTGQDYVSWNWKANGAGSSNTDGSETTTVSANTTAGFSICTFNNGSGSETFGHGLGVAPSVIITRNLGACSWAVYHKSVGATKYMQLNDTAAQTTGTPFDDTAPTASVFSLNTAWFGAGLDGFAYCFAEVPGYSKFGSYVGNNNTNGTFVYTGFRPSLIIVKRTDSTGNWVIEDNKRLGYNPSNNHLYPNLSNAEGAGYTIDQLSNGFKVRVTSADINASSGSYIYMAFGQPIISNGGVCATAR